jgi:hypothetical protein
MSGKRKNAGPENGTTGKPARKTAAVDDQQFEQLTLDATIIGPGMRSEDPYEPGTRVKVEGERGVFIYKCASISQAGLVSLHLIQDGMFRAVRPELVAPVKKVRRRR